MLLRVVVGFHFFSEGTTKLQDPNFTSLYFLKAAKGPLAPYFHGMLEDPDGSIRLCVNEVQGDDGATKIEIDPSLTLELWRDFVDRADGYYGFGSTQEQKQLAELRIKLANDIKTARENQDRSVDTAKLEELRAEAERNILAIRSQQEKAGLILENHKEELLDWQAGNRVAVLAHFGTRDRLDGFYRDGENRDKVATDVSALREQVHAIRADREKELKGWTSEIESIWDSLESQITNLAVANQATKPPMKLHRMYAQENSRLKTIDRIIPWFDTIVGGLLILGLFTRCASLAGALFLFSVVLTQPPWIAGATPTIYQTIELFALIVLFATCAGRMGGLDYFFSSKSGPTTNN